jgi:hypothetical protein
MRPMTWTGIAVSLVLAIGAVYVVRDTLDRNGFSWTVSFLSGFAVSLLVFFAVSWTEWFAAEDE